MIANLFGPLCDSTFSFSSFFAAAALREFVWNPAKKRSSFCSCLLRRVQVTHFNFLGRRRRNVIFCIRFDLPASLLCVMCAFVFLPLKITEKSFSVFSVLPIRGQIVLLLLVFTLEFFFWMMKRGTDAGA